MSKKDTIENLIKALRLAKQCCNVPKRRNQIEIAIYEIEALCWEVQKIVKEAKK